MGNIVKDLTGYRLKINRNGKEVVNVPGILCVPGVLAAPKISVIGMLAAPLLGCDIRLEKERRKELDFAESVQKAAESVMDTAKKNMKTITEEMRKAWEAVSAEDPAEDPVEDPADSAPVQKESSAEHDTQAAAESTSDAWGSDVPEEIPSIEVKPDSSEQM
jgi:hypothetical protein